MVRIAGQYHQYLYRIAAFEAGGANRTRLFAKPLPVHAAGLIWYGGIIGLSSLLSKVKFFEWLAEVFKNNLAFDGHGNVAFFVIIFLSIIVRYFFASGSAYIVAMLPVFAMLANVSGAPLMLTALALLFSNSYGGMVTHYGGAAGPVIFGVGYNDIKSWWLVGAVLTILTFLVHITLGVWWWNMLIGWNML